MSFALRAGFVDLRRGRRGLVLGLALFAVVSEEELRALVRGGAAPARVEELAPTWEDYWLTRVLPALETERRPPILAGFLATLPAGTPSAAELLDGVPALEAELMVSLSGRPLEPMAWTESADVHLVGAAQHGGLRVRPPRPDRGRARRGGGRPRHARGRRAAKGAHCDAGGGGRDRRPRAGRRPRDRAGRRGLGAQRRPTRRCERGSATANSSRSTRSWGWRRGRTRRRRGRRGPRRSASRICRSGPRRAKGPVDTGPFGC